MLSSYRTVRGQKKTWGGGGGGGGGYSNKLSEGQGGVVWVYKIGLK